MNNIKTTVKELLDTKIDDIISDDDIFAIMYKDKPDNFFNEDGTPKEKNKSEYGIEYYPCVIEDFEIDFGIEIYNESRRVLTITNGYKEKNIYWNQNGQVYYIYDNLKTFDITSKAELEKIKPYIEYSVGAIIYGLGENIYFRVYFDEQSYYEAGVWVYGNSGDCTFDNAYYSYMDEVTPFFNKGWMIWGLLSIFDNKVNWIPYLNIEVEEDKIEWYNEKYGINELKLILEIKKNFILNNSMEIKIKLIDLGIIFDDLLEY